MNHTPSNSESSPKKKFSVSEDFDVLVNGRKAKNMFFSAMMRLLFEWEKGSGNATFKMDTDSFCFNENDQNKFFATIYFQQIRAPFQSLQGDFFYDKASALPSLMECCTGTDETVVRIGFFSGIQLSPPNSDSDYYFEHCMRQSKIIPQQFSPEFLPKKEFFSWLSQQPRTPIHSQTIKDLGTAFGKRTIPSDDSAQEHKNPFTFNERLAIFYHLHKNYYYLNPENKATTDFKKLSPCTMECRFQQPQPEKQSEKQSSGGCALKSIDFKISDPGLIQLIHRYDPNFWQPALSFFHSERILELVPAVVKILWVRAHNTERKKILKSLLNRIDQIIPDPDLIRSAREREEILPQQVAEIQTATQEAIDQLSTAHCVDSHLSFFEFKNYVVHVLYQLQSFLGRYIQCMESTQSRTHKLLWWLNDRVKQIPEAKTNTPSPPSPPSQ